MGIFFDSHPKGSLEIPNSVVFPVAQDNFGCPLTFFCEDEIGAEYIVPLEDGIRVIGTEVDAEHVFAFGIDNRNGAFVLAPFIRGSESDYPQAIVLGWQGWFDEDVG
jgi:hypothetical protein